MYHPWIHPRAFLFFQQANHGAGIAESPLAASATSKRKLGLNRAIVLK